MRVSSVARPCRFVCIESSGVVAFCQIVQCCGRSLSKFFNRTPYIECVPFFKLILVIYRMAQLLSSKIARVTISVKLNKSCQIE